MADDPALRTARLMHQLEQVILQLAERVGDRAGGVVCYRPNTNVYASQIRLHEPRTVMRSRLGCPDCRT